MAERQRIAVIGAGSVGSAFAFYLARAGHEVTVVARGERLLELQREVAIVTTRGARALVRVEPALPTDEAFDLVIVAVLGWQVDALLPTLGASSARAIVFAFNTFGGLARLRDAVGRERFGWAFPAVVAKLVNHRLEARFVPRALAMFQTTTLGALPDFTPPWVDAWTKTFCEADVASVSYCDMTSWLETHVALMTVPMSVGVCVHQRGVLSADERSVMADAWKESFALVRRRGHRVVPWNMALVSALPRWALRGALRVLARLPQLRDFAATTGREPRWLLDQMLVAEPVPALERVCALLG